MSNPIVQYFKDTRSELNHVAWPTQRQTAVFTALVAAISLGVAAYVGALDYGFTGALTTVVNDSGNVNAQNALPAAQPAAATTSSSQSNPTFGIPGATSSAQ